MLQRFAGLVIAVVVVAGTLAAVTGLPVHGQPAIEDRLVIITPVARTVADPTLAAFTEFARRELGVTVRGTIVSAGTPVAYGRIREWAGRPEADVFWGGEPALFDDLVLMHPLIPWRPEPQAGLEGRRVLITAGRNDPICPAPRTQGLADWYREQGAEVMLHWHGGGHELRQDELAAAAALLG